MIWSLNIKFVMLYDFQLKNFSENLETMPVTCKGKVNYLEEPKSLSVKGWHLHGEAYTHRSCQNPVSTSKYSTCILNIHDKLWQLKLIF